ncbi:hypothetical protein E2I00_000519 [Balaenoptera physalus]|uniref:Bcl-2 Bcl-2 homology region 1-3 domain-containing protein n=1 Tax=Balaenoptera physalus TaxID=9770 RepID=A0A643C5X1_BALPH|nr:hypothetical protein E2I00_000519 [Balaenoptera physalus]
MAWSCLPAPSVPSAPPEHRRPAPGAAANRKRPGSSWADELELIRPSVYRNVARQLNISLQSETVVTDAFLAVAAQIFSAGITWGKVVSLYSVAAGLAVDCVRQAQPALVHALVDCLGEFVRKTLATWLRRRGGWVRECGGARKGAVVECLSAGSGRGDGAGGGPRPGLPGPERLLQPSSSAGPLGLTTPDSGAKTRHPPPGMVSESPCTRSPGQASGAAGQPHL